MNYRRRANFILGFNFTLFAITVGLRVLYKDSAIVKLLYFVLEAALVGGIADWFAITALFSKPLGFPYHTAIIPRNRLKLVEAVGQIVERNLLGFESIKAKIERTEFAEPLLNLVDARKGYLAEAGADYLENMLRKLDLEKAARQLEDYIKREAEKLDIARAAKKIFPGALDSGVGDRWLDLALDELIALAHGPQAREKIFNLIKEQERQKVKDSFFKSLLADLLEATGSLDLDHAAAALQGELLVKMLELKESTHPLRLRIKEMLIQAAADLDSDNIRGLEKWKDEAVRDIPLTNTLVKVLEIAVSSLLSPSASSRKEGRQKTRLHRWAVVQIKIYWNRLAQDQSFRDWVNRYAREAAARIASSEHYLIGTMVKDTLNSFSNSDLNSFVEAKAGNDLQWIRVNGSLIGGTIGFLMFLALNYL